MLVSLQTFFLNPIQSATILALWFLIFVVKEIKELSEAQKTLHAPAYLMR